MWSSLQAPPEPNALSSAVPSRPNERSSASPNDPSIASARNDGQIAMQLRMAGRTLAVQRQPVQVAQAGAPAVAAPPPAPLDYDRAPYALPMLDRAQTAANVTALLSKKVTAREITSFAVVGVQPGTHAEIFVLAAMHGLAMRTRWATEADLVTAIGWPPPGGGAAPQGRVTVRISATGAATAALIAAGVVPAVPRLTAADARARLIADFGFSAVTGWTGANANKDAAELSDVVAALTLLKARAPNDIPALAGVELIRVASLGGETAGEFTMGGAPAQPGGPPVKPSLKLADRTFADAQAQFFGGGPGAPTVPASFQMILHEVGHAVEKEQQRKALAGVVAATADRDAARARLKENSDTYDKRFAEAKRAGKLARFYKTQEGENKRLEKDVETADARIDAEKAMVQQTQVGAAAAAPARADAATLATAAADVLRTARATVQAMSADDVRASAAYLQAIENTATAITAFVANVQSGAGAIEDLELVPARAAFDRDRAYLNLRSARPVGGRINRAIEPLARVAYTQDLWFDAENVLARTRIRTLRLQKFVDLVTTHGIRPFTKYAAENSKLKPAEFYAEAYSLWLTDPAYLKTNFKLVFDFFESGDYRR